MEFQLEAPFEPSGDQPQAIAALVAGLDSGKKHQVLMGVTGSGKTFTMANVIQQLQRPTLVISHNKTLAAQLYAEFKEFFPHNAVHYFVSYYDYYQPEAYIPQRDIYIEKDASINQEIDRLRLAATSALVSRRDVIIVASVSSIYGLGSPEDYRQMMVAPAPRADDRSRRDAARSWSTSSTTATTSSFERGKFRVRGDCVEVWPATRNIAFRIEFWGDEVEQLSIINPTSGEMIETQDEMYIYPAKHFVMPEERIGQAVEAIRQELDQQLQKFRDEGKLLEAQRLNARTRYDLEMLQEVGYCPGIENYSRPLCGPTDGDCSFRCRDSGRLRAAFPSRTACGRSTAGLPAVCLRPGILQLLIEFFADRLQGLRHPFFRHDEVLGRVDEHLVCVTIVSPLVGLMIDSWSTSSPQNSTRKANSSYAGQTSTQSPRTRNLPRSKLTSLRSYRMFTSLVSTSSRSIVRPRRRATIIWR